MKTLLTLAIVLLISISKIEAQDTFSIVAVDPETGEVGSAGASCVNLSSFPGFSDDFLGELFPGLGAINTQAFYNQSNQINARNRMNAGDTPSEIIDWLINNDVSGQPALRQYGIAALIDEVPQTAAHTGSSTDDYKNHITGLNYSIQGNILLGQEILDSMESRFVNAEGDLACKLMAALQGANVVGADTRCTPNGTSSLFAFVKVAQPNDDFGDPSFVQSVRTSNGEGVEPIDALQTLFDMNHNCIVLSTNEQSSSAGPFSVFPNPVEDMVTIKSIDSEVYDMKVIDPSGSILSQTKIYKRLDLDVSHFHSGIYFIRISNNKDAYVLKMIKK